MIEHVYDEKTQTLIVTEDKEEIFKCEGIGPEKAKDVLANCIFNTKDGKRVGYDEKSEAFVDKADVLEALTSVPRLVDPNDCPTDDCGMREEPPKK